ncbi:MAG: GNAT family N-acetyltransferase [Defluviitaleaceae bacterium]|nr:GNAT family N-acetyltransferase [Defluviitaleaceae bacterium]
MDGKIELTPCTNEHWHEFWVGYVADPMMSDVSYVYDYEGMEKAYHVRMADATRKYFTIICDGKVIGQIYLKKIDYDKKSADFGISMVDDLVKGKGYGTRAIELLLEYAFGGMGLDVITADTVLRNVCSQHVLEKIGFVFTHMDGEFRYYKIAKRDDGL